MTETFKLVVYKYCIRVVKHIEWFILRIMYAIRKGLNIASAWIKKFKRVRNDYGVGILGLFIFVVSIFFISSSTSIWTQRNIEKDAGYISNHHFLLPTYSRSYNRRKYEYHTQLESHRFQMLLSEKRSSSKPELHQIMSKQSSSKLNPSYFLEGKEEVRYKKILYWSPVFILNKAFPELYGLGVGQNVYRRAGCPVWQCETSQDRSNLSQYDAVLFHYITFQGWGLPKTRYPHQRYVFFETEPPAFNRSSFGFFAPDMMKYFFNWTMTFRWDSDVVHPYGWIEPNGTVPLHPNEEEYERLVAEPLEVNYATGKTKLGAWMVTNCEADSGRNDLIIQLIEHGIDVDVYGACGNLTCGIFEYHVNGNSKTDDTDEPCREMISAKYKFYFALENSLCIDYVTEKFYALMRYPIVLVVMDAHGNHAKAAPPHSYINALDFPSTSALADYLIKLDGDDKLYNEYFWWKKHFTIRNSLLSGIFYKNFCNLCAALHDPSRQSVKKTYPDLIKWWIDDSECKRASFDGIYTD